MFSEIRHAAMSVKYEISYILTDIAGFFATVVASVVKSDDFLH